jgi:hypothetical protein
MGKSVENARKKEESFIDLKERKVKVRQIETQDSWNDQTVVLEKIENLQRSIQNEMAEISYKIRKIEDRKQELSRRVDLNGQIIVMAVKSQDTILEIVQKGKKEKIMITKEKKDPTEPKEKVVNMMRVKEPSI